MILFLYSLVNFISATLIFFIQPLAAKTVLPVLGGAPYVWNGCMVFFQAVLLMGYIYAHLLNTYANVKQNAIIHLGLFTAAAVLMLPLDIAGLAAGGGEAKFPLQWLISSLFIVLGLPFFIISATSPLTQSWFARTKSKWSEKPYMLYSASNLGSFAGLLAYPLLFEPFFKLKDQANAVNIGFLVLLVLFAIAAVYMVRNTTAPVVKKKKDRKESLAPWTKFKWVFYALIPSGLLYSVTLHITTDIASFPLLWVLPLAIYILSFVLVFSEQGRSLGGSRIIHFCYAGIMLLIAHVFVIVDVGFILLHIVGLFIFCMVCHQRLYDIRPKTPENLTKFYILMSFGGVLGGLLNTFIAPHAFNFVAEYPIFILFSLLVWYDYSELDFQRFRKGIAKPLLAITLMVLAFLIILALKPVIPGLREAFAENIQTILNVIKAIIMVTMIIVIWFQKDNLLVVMTVIILLVFLATGTKGMNDGERMILQERSLFGVNRVTKNENKQTMYFIHGTTVHGIQSMKPELKMEATTYYFPLRQIFQNPVMAKRTDPVAVVGQGIATLACYGKPGQQFDFYEIDALVSKIAEEEFTYMRDCPPEKTVITGDGRINISKQPDGKYGIIILDAFSSDSVPAHLLTKEAFEIYYSKLAEDGAIAANISNRYMDIEPILASVAHATGYEAASLFFKPTDEDYKKNELVVASKWVVITKNKKLLASLKERDKNWVILEDKHEEYLWTDDYSNIIRNLIWFKGL